MFCPNCAAQNQADQHYCRMCGLKLDAIATELSEQRPSAEFAELQKRKRRFETSGIAATAIAALIAVCIVAGKTFYYKLALLGPDLLFWSAFVALGLFALTAVVLFNYPRLFWKAGKHSPQPRSDKALASPLATKRLQDDSTFSPASVTERTTELLASRRER